MTTRLQWTRSGLTLVCETSKRAMPRTAWAFSLPPFAAVNTVSPCIALSLVLDSVTGIATHVLAASTETLPAGYSYTLNWSADGGVTWEQFVLGAVTAVSTRIPITTRGVDYQVQLSRAYNSIVERYAQVTISVAATAAPAAVSGLAQYWVGTTSYLQWAAPSDKREVECEVRIGLSAESGELVARQPKGVTSLAVTRAGTYWLAHRYQDRYSSWVSVDVDGTISQNVVQTWDEQGAAWPGTLGGAAALVSGALALDTSVGLTGTYEVPAAHVVDLGSAQLCVISAVYSHLSLSITPWDDIPVFDECTSVDGVVSDSTTVALEIAIAGNDGVFGAWLAFIPGHQYFGRKFKLRISLGTASADVIPVIETFSWTVDMPDRIESKAGVAVPTSGATITYSTPFQVVPSTHITITDMQSGDYLEITDETAAGFTVRCYNAGTAVARTINRISRGY